MKKAIACQLLIAISAFAVPAQSTAHDPFGSSKGAYEDFKRRTKERYDDFKKKVNDRYADFMRRSWERYAALAGIPVPEDDVKPIPPVVLPPAPIDEDKPIEDRNLEIKKTPIESPPEPIEQPQPIAPVKEDPKPSEKYNEFFWYGNRMRVREIPNFHISVPREDAVATAWSYLDDNSNNLLYDCLNLRDRLNLCDWAYLSVLNALSESMMGKGSNEATLLMAYLYCQSGYSMRIAFDGPRLVMLFGSDHIIYNKIYYKLGNEYFYPYNNDAKTLNIFDAAFPNEKRMSLMIDCLPELEKSITEERIISSERYEDMKAGVRVNKNIIDFFNSYPTSEINSNKMTRWAMYARTPLCKEATSSLYPTLRKHIEGKTQLQAANMLLNWVQTGFVYEYDDKVWGGDRAFFGDETLFYPYCDCEDRSILFSHLVRDLLGLNVALVYYPGHLATAVAFTDNVSGDYIMINNRKFIVCDPTFINAPVGRTMSGMENSKAEVIVL